MSLKDFTEDTCSDPEQLDPNYDSTPSVLSKVELIKEDYERKSIFTRHCNAEQCTLNPIPGAISECSRLQ